MTTNFPSNVITCSLQDSDYKYCRSPRHLYDSVDGHSDICFRQSISSSFVTARGRPISALSTAMLTVISLKFANEEVWGTSSLITDVPCKDLRIEIQFSVPLNPVTVTTGAFTIKEPTTSANMPLVLSQPSSDRVVLAITDSLTGRHQYQLEVSNQLKGSDGEGFEELSVGFVTEVASTTDEKLLTKVQQKTFKYFWDFAHPDCGMARERDTSEDTVTTGGSGFGLMCVIVGIERGFISRQNGLDRLDQVLSFLETADRFHGAWPHWLDGKTGKVIPFSEDDDGADLVETAYMIQGLLTFREYLNPDEDDEKTLSDRITSLWCDVEWDWFTQDGQEVLYWHWSPNKGWVMNHPIQGYNEALITYVLAASSPTHPIDKKVYHQGWAQNGAIKNGKTFYGYKLPLGDDYGGPLFFTHYSFLGMDPRNLNDKYASYWEQNVNHTNINRAYCLDNPLGYSGYGEDFWGLTSCDVIDGYTACSPTNDVGVVASTAALSSFPYAANEAMKVLQYLYNDLGNKMWKEYGFYDSCDLTEKWESNSFLAIDEGPIIIMIENYRSALLWGLFMNSSEVQEGLKKLDFTY